MIPERRVIAKIQRLRRAGTKLTNEHGNFQQFLGIFFIFLQLENRKEKRKKPKSEKKEIICFFLAEKKKEKLEEEKKEVSWLFDRKKKKKKSPTYIMYTHTRLFGMRIYTIIWGFSS